MVLHSWTKPPPYIYFKLIHIFLRHIVKMNSSVVVLQSSLSAFWNKTVCLCIIENSICHWKCSCIKEMPDEAGWWRGLGVDRTGDRGESFLFHRKRALNRLVKRKSVKYQFCDDEKSWTIDFCPWVERWDLGDIWKLTLSKIIYEPCMET